MSRFKRLSHVIWCCKYHFVWVPKYQFRILKGPIAEELYKPIHVYCGRMDCEVIELNIQEDHAHLLVSTKSTCVSMLNIKKRKKEGNKTFNLNY